MSLKVLVVDDDPIMHRVVQLYLERNGHQMLSASNGHQALERALIEVPDVILLDLTMPEMGGLTVLRQLKEATATENIPVLVVTANTDPATHLESAAAGAVGFLTKPFRPAELLAEIGRLTSSTEQGSSGEASGR